MSEPNNTTLMPIEINSHEGGASYTVSLDQEQHSALSELGNEKGQYDFVEFNARACDLGYEEHIFSFTCDNSAQAHEITRALERLLTSLQPSPDNHKSPLNKPTKKLTP